MIGVLAQQDFLVLKKGRRELSESLVSVIIPLIITELCKLKVLLADSPF